MLLQEASHTRPFGGLGLINVAGGAFSKPHGGASGEHKDRALNTLNVQSLGQHQKAWFRNPSVGHGEEGAGRLAHVQLDGLLDDASRISLGKAVSSEGYYDACNHAREVHAGVGSTTEYVLILYTAALYTRRRSGVNFEMRYAEEKVHHDDGYLAPRFLLPSLTYYASIGPDFARVGGNLSRNLDSTFAATCRPYRLHYSRFVPKNEG